MCTRVAPASNASCVDSICSVGVTGTAGLSFLRGTDPVIATAITTGSIEPSHLLCVEKYRLALALQVDVEDVDDLPVPLFPVRDQGVAPHGMLDDVEHRVLRVQLSLVGKIHSGRHPDVDPAGEEPEADVRRHRIMPVPGRNGTRLDGLESVQAC